METEMLKIFDENGNLLGVASRRDVHSKGYWHETFHCWFIELAADRANLANLYFQIRSESKKDYPGLLDITAAGHILADEEIIDGVREIEEEIGFNLSYHELVPIGVIKYRVKQPELIDNELANVFLYQFKGGFEQFELQLEEVAGIVKVDFHQFCQFWKEQINTINIQGFKITGENRELIDSEVSKSSFVTHGDSYFDDILPILDDYIQRHSQLT